MSKFTKKPVTIEAIRWPGNKFEESPPKWFGDAMYKTPGSPGFVMRHANDLLISTLEGEMIAKPGDWIIRGVKGEIYPCKPDIFEMTYAPAADSDTAQEQAQSCHFREAIAIACEGFNMSSDLRKHLETALWANYTPPAATPARELAMAHAALLQAQPRSPQPGAWKVHQGAIDGMERHLATSQGERETEQKEA